MESGVERVLSTDLFVAGEGGYHTFRVPSLVFTPGGAVLAFAEGRRNSVRDTGLIEIVCRRSEDLGRTWGPLRVVVAEPETTAGNATPVADARAGVLFLPFCKNREDGPEPLIFEGKAPRTAWMTQSTDDGFTWDAPVDVTATVKPADSTWFAFGPGHGVQLASGRLVVPSVHARIVDLRHSDPCRAHVTLSDDGGASWRMGGVIDVATSSECEVVETANDQLYLNARIEAPGAGRVSAWSFDGGATFTDVTLDERLTDGMCQGSLAPRGGDPRRVVLVNAAGPKRERLVARSSDDGGRTFGEPRLLDGGKVAYSDTLLAPDGSFLCLYERGEAHPYERLTFLRFRL